MKRSIFLIALGWLSVTDTFAQPSGPPLIVVEDRGGASALPYYRPLHPQPQGTSLPASNPSVSIGSAAEAEAAMLPVRSTWLSPGDVSPRVVRAPGLTPLFLIGDDPRSRTWLRQRLAMLRERRAVGLVVNVESMDTLTALRKLAPGLTLSPISGDDIAQRLGLRHYPVLITATGIEQ